MHLFFATSVMYAYTQADFFGKIIFWGLFILSGLSWFILIQKIILTKKLRSYNAQIEKFFAENKDSLLSLSVAETIREGKNEIRHPYLDIFHALKGQTIEFLNKNKSMAKDQPVQLSIADVEQIESHGSIEIANHVSVLEKNLFVLSTVVTLAPFLGLLGTVWGILLTFSNMQAHGAMSSNNTVLAGLALALSTTVIGLVVAIPALIAYNYLKHKIFDMAREMEIFSHKILSKIEIQYRKVDRQ